MGKTYATFVCSLKQQHHLLWLFLGAGFSLFLCSQLVHKGPIGIALMVGLLAMYCCAGHWAARLIARSTCRSTTSKPSAALFLSSVKIGALFSVLSALFHLALLVVLESNTSLELPPHTREPIVLRAAIFPLLACLGAACTASGMALTEPTEVVHFPTESDLTALTD
jgi:hypothetical protein